jgi:hypothetical protein
VSGSDPAEPAGAASFHQTAASGIAAALACAAAADGGGHPEAAAAGLAAGRSPQPPSRAAW